MDKLSDENFYNLNDFSGRRKETWSESYKQREHKKLLARKRQGVYVDIAENSIDFISAKKAFEKIDDDFQEAFVDIAMNANFYKIGLKAVEKIDLDNQEAFNKIVKNAKDYRVINLAKSKINKRFDSTKKIIKHDQNENTRNESEDLRKVEERKRLQKQEEKKLRLQRQREEEEKRLRLQRQREEEERLERERIEKIKKIIDEKPKTKICPQCGKVKLISVKKCLNWGYDFKV